MRTVANFVAALLLACSVGCATPGRGLVAVLTDFGQMDQYRGILTAAVLNTNPQAHVIEITHSIEPFNILHGAFVLAESVQEFPEGTVFVAIVDPGVGTDRGAVVVQTAGGRFLVGPDNGLLDLAIQRDGPPRGIWRIENRDWMRPGMISSTFQGRDVFGPVAARLARGEAAKGVGPTQESWVRLDILPPSRERDGVTGTIVRVDYYGNIITNIPSSWVEAAPFGTPLEIKLDEHTQKCTWQRTYGEVPEGAFLTLGTPSGTVEIARNRESAARSLDAQVGKRVRVCVAKN